MCSKVRIWPYLTVIFSGIRKWGNAVPVVIPRNTDMIYKITRVFKNEIQRSLPSQRVLNYSFSSWQWVMSNLVLHTLLVVSLASKQARKGVMKVVFSGEGHIYLDHFSASPLISNCFLFLFRPFLLPCTSLLSFPCLRRSSVTREEVGS